MPRLDDERRCQRRSAKSMSSSPSRPVCWLACGSDKGGGERSVLAANSAVAQHSLNKRRRRDHGLNSACSAQLLGFCPLAPLVNRNACCSTLVTRRSDGSQDLLLAPPSRGRSAMAPLSVDSCLGLMDAVWKLPRVLDCIVVATVTAIRQTMRFVRQAAYAVCSIVSAKSALISKGITHHPQLSHQALHRSVTANVGFDESASQALYRKRSVECVPFQSSACVRYRGDVRCDAMLWLASQARYAVVTFYPMRAGVPSIQSNAQWSACCQPLRSVRAERKFLMARMISTTKVSA